MRQQENEDIFDDKLWKIVAEIEKISPDFPEISRNKVQNNRSQIIIDRIKFLKSLPKALLFAYAYYNWADYALISNLGLIELTYYQKKAMMNSPQANADVRFFIIPKTVKGGFLVNLPLSDTISYSEAETFTISDENPQVEADSFDF